MTVTAKDGAVQTFDFDHTAAETPKEITVQVGELMRWSAKTDLTFYEICEPPYQDGRFENLPGR